MGLMNVQFEISTLLENSKSKSEKKLSSVKKENVSNGIPEERKEWNCPSLIQYYNFPSKDYFGR